MGALDELLAKNKVQYVPSKSVEPVSTVSASGGGSALDNLMTQHGLTQSTISQSAGSIPNKGTFQALLPTKEQLPEMIGSMAGGFARTTGAGALAAGVGAATGDVFNQYRQAIYEPEKAPKNISESLSRYGNAFARGAGSEVLGRKVIGPVLNWMSAPGAASITPEIIAGKEAFERQLSGRPPLEILTENEPVQALSRYAELSWPFGGALTREKNASMQGLKDFAERISEGMAQDHPPEVIGDMVNTKIKLFEGAFKKAKDALYDPIWNQLKDQPAKPANSIKTLEDILERRSGAAELPGTDELRTWLGQLKGDEGIPSMLIPESPGMVKTIGQLKGFRNRVGARGDFNDAGVVGLKSDIEELYAAASKDIESAAEAVNPALGKSLKEADAIYSSGIKQLQSTLVKALQKKAEDSPHKMFDLVIRKNAPNLVRAAREIIGDDGIMQLRKQWFDDLITKSESTVEGKEIISPHLLAGNIRKMGDTLSELFSDNPVLMQRMNDLGDISKLMTRGKKVTGGSQTAYIMNALKTVRGMIVAPLVRSELGREYLTTGFPKLGGAVAQAAKPATELMLQRKNVGVGNPVDFEWGKKKQ